MIKKYLKKDLEIAGRKMTFEVNKLAPQADASVIARYGDTEVMVAVMMGASKPMADGGVPLTVDFVERLYAGGLIKGSRWVKREGRGSDESILTGRLIDRSIRPLFPKDLTNEIQIIVTLLSTDNANDHDVLAINAVSAALSASRIPWGGPIGAVRVGYIAEHKSLVTNPLVSEMEFSEIDLVVSSNSDGVVMIEAGAKQLEENTVAEAIEMALTENKKLISAFKEIQKEVSEEKSSYEPHVINKELMAEIDKNHHQELEEHLTVKDSALKVNSVIIDDYKKSIGEKYVDNPDKNQIGEIVETLLKKILRKRTLEKKIRIDGRKLTDVRPISGEVGLLPRTHGSAIFQRGLTQVLSVVTLASPSLEQWIETAEGMEEKSYIHHYNAPPYSSGETGRSAGPGRREIGHGALAERALFAVIPAKSKFPYTIRVVSEVLSQNGSSSMGSTCGSTLALMDAGVPILAPVSGVAMGLIAESDSLYAILTDLRGEEDFYGNMDFKIAGSEKGITAIQLDIKLNDKFKGLTMEMIQQTLNQARDGRLEILHKMLAIIPEYRHKVSQYAPKVATLQIPTDKIGEVIGPGGRSIKNIIATTGADVDIKDDGTVTISSIDPEAVEKAIAWIDGMTREVMVGEEFEGEVKRILPFGAFVEVLPGKEGLVHVSRMSSGFVSDPNQVVKLGQKVKVKVHEIDEMGRMNLSMYWGPKDNTNEQSSMSNEQSPTPQQGFAGPRFAGPRPGGSRGGFNRGGRGGPRNRY